MENPISPINITSAALITQFCIVIVIFLAIWTLRWGEAYLFSFIKRYDPLELFFYLLFFTLITMGVINFSDGYSDTWKPFFTGVRFTGIPWSLAFSIVFILDALLISILVAKTGGSISSCFVPLYFVIPALAIFLREPLGRIFLYGAFVTVGFSYNLFFGKGERAEIELKKRKPAYWIVAILSMVLTSFIGYITRPK